jgi:hypothetical protein
MTSRTTPRPRGSGRGPAPATRPRPRPRPTPKDRATPRPSGASTPAGARTTLRGLRLPDGTRSAQSPFIWRLFAFLSLVALGLCLVLASDGLVFYASAWGFIAAGWFAIAMWLWRKNVRYEDAIHARRSGRAP